MSAVRRAYLELHLAVFLYGFTAILGDLITLSATILVWWRVLFTSISLLFLIQFGKRLKYIPKRLLFEFLGIGIVIALHWITFFASIKYANASVALVCLATGSFFTSILEPIMTRTTFKWYEFGLGLLVVPGMALVVQGLTVQMLTGVWLGLISSLLIVVFSIFNKQRIHLLDTTTITFLEMGSAWIFISFLLPFYFYFLEETIFLPSWRDGFYLLILALVCTTLAFVLNLRALRHISAFAANLTINLEPVYGILLAIVILNENKELTSTFYLGVFIIMLSVLSYPLIRRRYEL